jgi:hypothetical protein
MLKKLIEIFENDFIDRDYEIEDCNIDIVKETDENVIANIVINTNDNDIIKVVNSVYNKNDLYYISKMKKYKNKLKI